MLQIFGKPVVNSHPRSKRYSCSNEARHRMHNSVLKKAVSCPILKLMDEDTCNVMLGSDIRLGESAHR
jgi:predicted nuclease with RNAse H fold